jgi:hypothetical protein
VSGYDFSRAEKDSKSDGLQPLTECTILPRLKDARIAFLFPDLWSLLSENSQEGIECAGKLAL